MEAISHKYTGKPFPFRNPEERVALVIEIEKARYTSHRNTLRRLCSELEVDVMEFRSARRPAVVATRSRR